MAAAARPAGQAGTRDGSSRRRCTTSGTAAAGGGETRQTGRDATTREAGCVGPVGGRGGGQNPGNVRARRPTTGDRTCHMTSRARGIKSRAEREQAGSLVIIHASDAAQDPNSAPHGRRYKSCAGGRIVQCPRLRVLPKAKHIANVFICC